MGKEEDAKTAGEEQECVMGIVLYSSFSGFWIRSESFPFLLLMRYRGNQDLHLSCSFALLVILNS